MVKARVRIRFVAIGGRKLEFTSEFGGKAFFRGVKWAEVVIHGAVRSEEKARGLEDDCGL
jgi:hypothetical protein